MLVRSRIARRKDVRNRLWSELLFSSSAKNKTKQNKTKQNKTKQNESTIASFSNA
jgi:hypothetical protein